MPGLPTKSGDWVLRGGVALAFLVFGLEKFPSGPKGQWVKFFDQVGIGQWFRYFTGIVEIAGAGLVLIPSSSRFGAPRGHHAGRFIHPHFHHPSAGKRHHYRHVFAVLIAFWWNRRTESS